MTVELLREGAAQLREAAASVPGSPWILHVPAGGSSMSVASTAPGAISRGTRAARRIIASVFPNRGYRERAAYLQMMQPALAFALADSLDMAASLVQQGAWELDGPQVLPALRAARIVAGRHLTLA